MNCQYIAEILDDGDSRSLSAAERHALEAHVAGCAECRAAFAAHEAMGAMAVPAMSPSLAELCRRAVVAQSASRSRRAGGRPFFVVGLLVAGAAAAALVGVQLVSESGVDREVAADDDAAPSETPSESESSEVASSDAAAESAADVAPPLEAEGATPSATGFTVGVAPLLQQATNPETIRATEEVYRIFLDELRKIPNLELVEMDSVVRVTNAMVNSLPPVGAAGTAAEEAPTLVLVDPRGAATGTVSGSVYSVSGSSSAVIESATLPAALRGRIEGINSGTAATADFGAGPGVVNVILDNNIPGVRVDLTYEATSEPEPLAHDYEIQVTSRSIRQGGDWTFAVNARSRAGTSFTASTGARAGSVDSQELTRMVEQLVSRLLHDALFPVDDAYLAAVEQRVLDTRLSLEARVDDLDRLMRLNERTGNAPLPDSVALAVGDMLLSAGDWERQRLLSELSVRNGVDSAVLVPPLGTVLRNDANQANRRAAVQLLAAFPQDPRARAALEAAANADASPEVRLNARWATLDATGRRDFVIASLLDTRLSDAERIQPLLLVITSIDVMRLELGTAVDATVANVINDMLRREQAASTRADLVGQLARENSPALTPLFIERLAEDEAEGVRRAALSALLRLRDEPGVDNALDRAAAEDPSPAIRRQIAVSRELQN